MSDSSDRIERLIAGVGSLLKTHSELRTEFELMFKRRLDDPPMALGRARKLLEVIVVEQYIRANRLQPPYKKKQLESLFDMIEELGKKGVFSLVQKALGHAVRVEGNAALHYTPRHKGDRISRNITDQSLMSAFEKLCELLESVRPAKGGEAPCFYLESLPPLFRVLYTRWQCFSETLPDTRTRDCVEILIRSAFPGLQVSDLELLVRISPCSPLPAAP